VRSHVGRVILGPFFPALGVANGREARPSSLLQVQEGSNPTFATERLSWHESSKGEGEVEGKLRGLIIKKQQQIAPSTLPFSENDVCAFGFILGHISANDGVLCAVLLRKKKKKKSSGELTSH
jgi:hypothetical protein